MKGEIGAILDVDLSKGNFDSSVSFHLKETWMEWEWPISSDFQPGIDFSEEWTVTCVVDAHIPSRNHPKESSASFHSEPRE